MVRGNLTGKNFPGAGTYYGFLGPGVQKYLSDAQGRLFAADGVVDDIGSALKSIGNGEQVVKDYFTSYASYHYQGCIDYLSTWTGIPYTRTSTTSGALSSAAVATPTCSHEADPDNTCAAIADGSGWCDCGDSNSYIIQTTGQPCAWTTLPATTSFDCTAPATSPASVAPSSQPPPTPIITPPPASPTPQPPAVPQCTLR